MLASKGAKLRTHEMHVRRTDNGGYIARHELRDRHGRPPADGQRSEAEYALSNPEELARHVADHMGAPAEEEEEGEE